MELPLASQNPQDISQIKGMLERSICRSIVYLSENAGESNQLNGFDLYHDIQTSDIASSNQIDNLTSGVSLLQIEAEVASLASPPNQYALTLPRDQFESNFKDQIGNAASIHTRHYALLRLETYKVQDIDPRLKTGELQRLSARDLRNSLSDFHHALYQENHLDSCQIMNTDGHKNPSQQFGQMMINRLDEPRYNYFILKSKHDMKAGTGLFSLGNIGFITDFHVLQQYRQDQLGKALLSILIDACQRALFEHVILLRPENCPAISYFKRYGFVEMGAVTSIEFKA